MLVQVRGGRGMTRRASLLPSRRAVLYVQAAGDAAAPADLPGWFTERAFHFYCLSVARLWRPAAARAGLDAACAQLRQAEGVEHVILVARGRAALAASRWSQRRGDGRGPDALILIEPELPARPALRLAIDCPVLVLAGPGRATRPGRLGGHVTWLQLADAGSWPDELGRWLGAYMYGQGRDQLL